MDTQEAPAESPPGSKISDLIAAAQELRKPFVSLEFFPPRTVAGVVNLRERIQRLKRVAPFFIDFTWGAGGNTADLTLDLVLEAKLEHGLEPNMHLTCTNMPVLKIDNALQACREHGVRNIVALRGDPPAGENQWLASEGGFKCALDLVQYIRQQHGDFFCVSVAGYPEGHPDRIKQRKGGLDALSEAERARCSVSPDTGEVYVCSDKDFEVELAYLKAKCEAGADVIITQMFFDASVYGRFVAECRRVGITQPIVPGIMPINAYGGFQRMTSFCRTRVPPNLLARIEVNKDNEAAIKEIGLDYGEQMCRELLQLGAPGLHFYTLNLEKVTVGILRRMGLAGDYDEPPTEDTAQMLDMIKSGPRSAPHSDATLASDDTRSIASAAEEEIEVEQAHRAAAAAAVGSSEVADAGLAASGRAAIACAEESMPGLMACREELSAYNLTPLAHARITVSLRVTAQNAVLVELLQSLGAEVRWCSSGVLATDDAVAAAVAAAGTAVVFARKGETAEEYWRSALAALAWPQGEGPNLVVDDGGDLALLLHEGVKVEEAFARSGALPNARLADISDLCLLWKLLAQGLEEDPQRWQRATRRIQGLTVSTAAGAHRLLRLEGSGALRVASINTSDGVTRTRCSACGGGGSSGSSSSSGGGSGSGGVNGSCNGSAGGSGSSSGGGGGGGRGLGRRDYVRTALAAGLRTLAGVELAGKTVVVCGFGEVGQACAAAVTAAGGRALVTEIDPICALQAAVDGYKVVTLEQALDAGATVFLTTTGVRATIGAPLMARMRDGSVVASVSHLDGEIELSALEREARRSALSEHASRYTFAATGASVVVVAEGRLLDLALARAPPQGWLAASTSLATQALALAELWRERSSGRYTRGTVSSVPRILDETAARLHLRGFGATLSSLTKEQSEYLRVAPEGPFKPYAYRY